jgi:1-acyl-sn-glycerol-3-phosphate acyltransferase
MMNTFEFLPSGSHNPRFGVRPGVIFGQPMEFSRYYGRERDREALRAVTDEIIAEIAKLSGQEYVNIYAKQAKEQAQTDQPGTDSSMLSIALAGVSRCHCKRPADG